MKSFKLVFSAALASILAACSSMEVDEADAYAENYPEDFSEALYMQIHPELVRIQRFDYVSEYNKNLSTVDGYDALKESDESAFLQMDTAVLHVMFTDPYVGGFTEEDGAFDWESGERDSVLRTYKLDTLSLSVGDSADLKNPKTIVLGLKADSAAQMFGSIEYNDDGTIKAIHGYSKCETTCSKEDTLDIEMSATNFIRKLSVGDTMSSILTSKDTHQIFEFLLLIFDLCLLYYSDKKKNCN